MYADHILHANIRNTNSLLSIPKTDPRINNIVPNTDISNYRRSSAGTHA